MRYYFGIDAVFSDSSGDEVAVLSSKIQDEDSVVFGLQVRLRTIWDCAGNLRLLSVFC